MLKRDSNSSFSRQKLLNDPDNFFRTVTVSKGLVDGVKGHRGRQLGQNIRLFRLGQLITVVPHGLGPNHEIQHGDTGLSSKERLPLDAAGVCDDLLGVVDQ